MLEAKSQPFRRTTWVVLGILFCFLLSGRMTTAAQTASSDFICRAAPISTIFTNYGEKKLDINAAEKRHQACENSCATGNADSCYKLARIYERDSRYYEYEKGVSYSGLDDNRPGHPKMLALMRGCELGSAKSCYSWAREREFDSAPTAKNQAKDVYIRACMLGAEGACNELANYHNISLSPSESVRNSLSGSRRYDPGFEFVYYSDRQSGSGATLSITEFETYARTEAARRPVLLTYSQLHPCGQLLAVVTDIADSALPKTAEEKPVLASYFGRLARPSDPVVGAFAKHGKTVGEISPAAFGFVELDGELSVTSIEEYVRIAERDDSNLTGLAASQFLLDQIAQRLAEYGVELAPEIDSEDALTALQWGGGKCEHYMLKLAGRTPETASGEPTFVEMREAIRRALDKRNPSVRSVEWEDPSINLSKVGCRKLTDSMFRCSYKYDVTAAGCERDPAGCAASFFWKQFGSEDSHIQSGLFTNSNGSWMFHGSGT
ncbi:hypothetical protein WNY37_00635 [Henriciella sp. AS95]|uniref:hypothetical protein n=1 Tax=Henriciella sp. AS95 TaxID=3135782 RepID=UPI00316CDEB1